MRLSKFVLILMLGLSLEGWAARPEISISHADSIVVPSGQAVLLSDIATVSFVGTALQKKALDIKLFNAMAEGEQKQISNVEMVRLLKEKTAGESELLSVNWTYFVSEKIQITAKKNHLSTRRINNQILLGLTDRCADCQFTIRNLVVPLILEDSPLSSFDLDTSSLRLAGGFVLPLRVSFAGVEKVFYVTGDTRTKTKALALNRALNMGEKISEKDVVSTETEITFQTDAFATLENLQGHSAGRYLQVGRVLLVSDLKKETVVQRGQIIQAISGDDNFEVSTQMQAEDSGAIGDLIRLKNTETQKLFSGRVVDRGVVRIQ